MLGEAFIVVLLEPCLTLAATLFHVKSRCQQRDPPEYPISPTEVAKNGDETMPVTGRCQTDAGERVMMREMHVAGLGCNERQRSLVSAIAWHVSRLEKRAVWLVSLLLLLNFDRDVLKMPMHQGWHVKSRVGSRPYLD